jgi:iron complex transport system substrate-binding protein
VRSALAAARVPERRVMVMEWLDPVYNCGHWIPDQIAAAGGIDSLAVPGGYSTPLQWEVVRAYDPEVLVVAPCGFHVTRTSEELGLLTGREGFSALRAARAGKVYVADADLFTQPSAPRLCDGIELLAHLFHPDVMPLPEDLRSKFARVT